MNVLDRFVIVVASSVKGCFVARVWADTCLDELRTMAAMLGPDVNLTAGPAGYDWFYHPKGGK